MTKLIFALCIILFAATASALLNLFPPGPNSDNWIDDKITSIISDTEKIYQDAQTNSEENLRTITDRIEKYGRDKPAEILANLDTRRNQFNALTVNVTASATFACTQRFLTGLDNAAQDGVNNVATCVEKFTVTARDTMARIRNAVSEGLLQLTVYKNRANSCHSQGIPVIINSIQTIVCLTRVKSELYSSQKDGPRSRVQMLMRSLARVNTEFDSCTVNIFDTYRRLASNLIPATRRCISAMPQPNTIPAAPAAAASMTPGGATGPGSPIIPSGTTGSGGTSGGGSGP